MAHITKSIPGQRLTEFLLRVSKLSGCEVQQVGTLVITWAFFENLLEQALWRLLGNTAAEGSLKTDRMMSSDRIKEFQKLGNKLSGEEWQEIVSHFCQGAENILLIRNTIAHGQIAHNSAINNPTWDGAIRKREGTIIHINEQTMGLTLDALFELILFVRELLNSTDVPSTNQKLLSFKQPIYKAMMASDEVRHLVYLMNFEKY